MIDIIIPTHNSKRTISRCLDSILNIKQNIYKIIIVDDGSTDGTQYINNYYASKYSNVYSIYQDNKGVSSARNNGLNHSHSDAVCFIDSDDFINANDFVYCLHLYYEHKDDLLLSNINFNNKNIGIDNFIIDSNVKHFLKNNYPLYGNELVHVVWNKIYNNFIIKKYNIRFPSNIYMGEDLIFVLRYILHLNEHMRVIQTNVTYYNYFVNKFSATNHFEKNALISRMLILQYIKKIYLRYNLSYKMINSLRTKAIYSIMLNGLKSSNKIKYLKFNKQRILHKKIFRISKDKFLFKDRMLIYLFKCMPVNLFYYFLNILDIIRDLY